MQTWKERHMLLLRKRYTSGPRQKISLSKYKHKLKPKKSIVERERLLDELDGLEDMLNGHKKIA